MANWQSLTELPFSKVGARFLVPPDKIEFADKVIHQKKDRGENGKLVLKFENPRHAGLIRSCTPHGMDRQALEKLKAAIATEGLRHPPLLRLHEGKLQLVNGERRMRVIRKLLEENAEVLDRTTGEKAPAKVVFKEIECDVEVLTDLEAYHRANTSDDSSVAWGEPSKVILVRYLMSCDNVSDADILRAVNQGKMWLTRVRSILEPLVDDDKTFELYATEKLNLAALGKLSQEPDKDLRHEMAAAMVRVSEQEHALQLKEAEAAVERKKEKLEEAKALKELGGGDDAVEEAENDLEEAKLAEERLSNGKPVAKTRHFKRGGGGSRAGQTAIAKHGLTTAKIRKKWIDPINEWLKANEEEREEGVDEEDARLIALLGKEMLGNNENIIKILKQHLRNKERRAKA